MHTFDIVVAVDANFGIGIKGALPWHLPADLKHFKEVTSKQDDASKMNAVIMGRKTWDSLPTKFRPLPGRLNVVLTRDKNWSTSDALVAHSLDEALQLLDRVAGGVGNVFVIGGAQIYEQAIIHPKCKKLWLTHIKNQYSCDAFFPKIPASFKPESQSASQEEGEVRYYFAEYVNQ